MVATLIARPDVRLLTLTGAGGVGKTRLAIAVASVTAPAFADGTSFVGLAQVRDPSLVPVTIARMLGVDGHGVSALAAALGDAARLLVLDNFEHLLAAGPLVVDLLVGCPRLTILVTSRAALRVSGEREFPVPPLALPAPSASSADSIAASPAVQLYCQRAEAVDPHFHLTEENAPTVAAICGRLDGLPLAIELAAARSKVLPPALLLPRLAQRLPLLTGGPRDVPARLRTMHEAITWSHGLLTTDEQRTFRRLAVFSGGFALEAAEHVCRVMDADNGTHRSDAVLEAIAALLDLSLLQRHDATAGGRFGMLETVREFALERLAEAGEEARAREAHAAYFVAFDERLDPNRAAPGERVDDRLWSVEAELPNFRAVLAHLVSVGDADRVFLLHALGDLAGIAAEFGWNDQAAMLLGAADRLQVGARLALRPTTDAARAAARDRARFALGEPCFQAWYEAGQQVRLDEAVALALAITLPERPPQQPSEGCRLTSRQAEVLRLLVAGAVGSGNRRGAVSEPAHRARPRLAPHRDAGRRQPHGGGRRRRPRPPHLTRIIHGADGAGRSEATVVRALSG